MEFNRLLELPQQAALERMKHGFAFSLQPQTELEAVASEIWRDPHLQSQAPNAAATEWLRPSKPRVLISTQN